MLTELRRQDRKIAGFFVTYEGLLEQEAQPLAPDPETLGEFADQVKAARSELRALGPGDTPLHRLLLEHLDETLDVLEHRLASEQALPHRYLSAIMRKLNTMVSVANRPAAQRADRIRRFLDHSLGMLDGIQALGTLAAGEARDYLLQTAAELPGFADKLRAALPQGLAGATAEALNQIDDGLQRLLEKTAAVAAAVRQAPVPRPGQGVVGPDYTAILRGIYRIDLDELLAWHRDEVEACRQRLHRVAAEVSPGRDPLRILEEDLGPYDSPDELLPIMEEFVALARERALEHITLPPGEHCEVWPVPEYLKDSYPWGGYFAGGSALEGSLKGAVFLNLYNYRTVTRGWMYLNAIHECYPGHHAHFVKTSAGNMPLTFKVGGMVSQAAALSEAVCIRTETLMQDIFGEPAFRVFVAYRRLHTAVRIWVDLLLHHFRQGPEQAAELYVRYLGFAPHVARGQVYAQQLFPGYFTNYYYGFKKVAQLERELGWDSRAFSEQIFSSGKISLATLRGIVELSPEDRRTLLQQFHR